MKTMVAFRPKVFVCQVDQATPARNKILVAQANTKLAKSYRVHTR